MLTSGPEKGVDARGGREGSRVERSKGLNDEAGLGCCGCGMLVGGGKEVVIPPTEEFGVTGAQGLCTNKTMLIHE